MVTRMMIITAVLFCLGAALVSATTIGRIDIGDLKPIPVCNCPKGYELRYPCQCYKFVRDIASWAEAKVYCEVMRATLVEVKDDATHNWVQRKLYIREATYNHHLLEKAEYWLGATDLEVESGWRWHISNLFVSYAHWLPNEPNNFLGYQNCMAIRRRCWDAKCIDYGWFDDDCYQKKFYICEKRGKPINSATIETPTDRIERVPTEVDDDGRI